MLTTAQVDHFRTFGFTVLPGYLADRVSALRGVIERMRQAGVLDLPGAQDGW